MLERVLTHLEKLVAFDTQNPPRTINANDGIFAYCAGVLRGAGCVVEIEDLGAGCVTLLAKRGEPSLVFNCHLDTVPADPAWTQDPFVLTVGEGEARGLGSCDIKGAAACLLAAAETTDEPVAVLLTSDEEAGDSDCVNAFLASDHGFGSAIVCEPTGARAVTRHRGIETCELHFTGRATHSSQPGAHADNALHHAAEWAARAIDAMHGGAGDNQRFNIGIIAGGVKTNIAASSASVRFGIRPHAETDADALITSLAALAPDPERAELVRCFSAPSFDAGPAGGAMIEAFGLEHADEVDFWTEGALFARAGLFTIVLGPGEISQAHAPDECVPTADLDRSARIYAGVIRDGAGIAKTHEKQGAAS